MSMRWNREAALLGIPDLPVEAFKHVGDRKIKPQGGGGGGGQTTSYTTNIPEYAKQPFMDLVGKSEALSNQPYQAYTGQRIEGFTPMQQQAQTSAANQQTAPQLAGATGLAAGAATSSFTNPGTAGAYMSPYMQQVVAMQQQDASRQAGIAGTQRAADFVKSGAFGGSRQAIMDAEAARNLALQQGEIQAKGLQSAFESGQGQFNNEMNRGLAGAQTLGQLGQQYFGQQMDITGLQNQMGAQQQALGQKQLDQQYNDFQTQRDYPYQQLGFLSDMLRGVQGSTRTMYSSTPQPSALQNIAGLGTAASAFMSRGGTVKYAGGGLVQAFAAGGAVEPLALPARLRMLSDQQLQQFSQQNAEDLFSMALAKSEMDARARLRQAGAPAQTPQGTVMDEVSAEMAPAQMGGIADAAPDMDFADGGIVGYAAGGEPFDNSLPQMERGDPRLMGLLRGAQPQGAQPSTERRSIVLPAGASEQDRQMVEMQNPDADVTVEGSGAFWGKLKDAFFYNSDTAAAKERGAVPDTGDEAARLAARYPAPPEKGLPAALPQESPAPPARSAASAPGGAPGIPGGVTASGSTGARAGLTGAAAFGFDPDKELVAANKKVEEEQKAREEALLADERDAKARHAARGKAGEGKESRIKEQQATLAGGEEKARKAALLQAGLAILSADPSRGGLAAIGEGAGKGFAQYRGDIGKLEEKRLGLLDKLDEIDDLRRQEANADGKELADIRSKLRGLRGDAIRTQLELMTKYGLDAKKDAAKMTVDLYIAQKQRETQVQTARIGASGRSNAQLEIINALNKDPALLNTYTAMQGRGFEPREAYTDYLTKFKPDPMRPGVGPMAYGDFVSMFPKQTYGAVPGGGKVLPR